jgi:hypothetical protein
VGNVDRDSLVGTATGYLLDGPEIQTPVGATFTATVHTGPGAHPGSYTMGTGSLPVLKQPGRGVNHPSPFGTEVKEE